MSFSINIQPSDTCKKYGVDSSSGFTITSKTPILSDELEKIQSILGAFVKVSIDEANLEKAEEKTKKYSSIHPNYSMNESEKNLFDRAQKSLDSAKKNYEALSKKYSIVYVSPFQVY
ncbi:MAG: hypothetical protein BGO14_07450 [Chlamydiales bacterium 38-26]|nr:hypothetical protein [Chlamydiales bacterium]OJV10838.1 MAG: hypothetical protein BGO14_07450 [Chlamydiales bacterium 38-26]